MTESVCLLGSGPTRKIIPEGMDIAGLSSGYLFAQHCDLFITVDKARHFPKYDGVTPCHVPKEQYVKGWNPMEEGPKGDMDLMCTLMRKRIEWCPGWADYVAVTPHETKFDLLPDFEDFTKPIGLGSTMNSIIFAVQLLHRLGYKAIHFAGCDLFEINYEQAYNGLKWMYRRAAKAGFEWYVTHPESRLKNVCPVEIPNGYISVNIEKADSPWAVA